MSTFTCECCEHSCAFDSWTLVRRRQGPTRFRCPYCGADYSVGERHCELIRSAAWPLERKPARSIIYSPWHDSRVQPTIAGTYHVVLREATGPFEQSHISLRYDGLSFVTPDDLPITSDRVMCWRGIWPETP